MAQHTSQKGKSDAARGNIFTKIGREIAIAVKQGGSDPNTNSKLRDAIAKAKSNNMPNDNINRSIKKAAGELDSVNYEEFTYEGYAAGGVAVIVECLTDNKTARRATSDTCSINSAAVSATADAYRICSKTRRYRRRRERYE